MRILMVHTYYREPGGEDIVYESEVELLRSYGHIVQCEEYRNADIDDRRSALGALKLAVGTSWSRTANRQFEELIDEFRPDVAHFHNTLPQVPPSVFSVCRKAGVAVVHTLHNYRLLCPSATFFRDGGVCTDCLGRRFAWPGILHACYRNSRSQTASVALMQTSHKLTGTWKRDVHAYLALSQYSRDLFINGGLSPELIHVKPNFLISDAGPGSHNGGYAIFVGRLSREKGLRTLVKAWDRLNGEFQLKIVGDGPLGPFVRDASRRNRSVEWLGRRSTEEVLDLVGDASMLVFTSEWHETFGRTVVEAMSRGTPVIASNLGAARELVQPGVTGLRYEAGDPEDLARQVTWMYQNPDQVEAMRAGARQRYLRQFTAERNYELLISAYRSAMARVSGLNSASIESLQSD